MAQEEERIDLVVTGNTSGAQSGLKQLTGALTDSDKAIADLRQQFTDMAVSLDAAKIKIAATKQTLAQQRTAMAQAAEVTQQAATSQTQLATATKVAQAAVQGSSGGLGAFVGFLGQFYDKASMGASGLRGLANVLGAVNPVLGTVANGFLSVVDAMKRFVLEAIPVVSNAQSLVINLESLAAQELVKAGKFGNAVEAMDTAKVAAADLLRQLQLLGLESPFENQLVVQTFRMGMAYGFNADQAFKLTRASLDMAAGLGKSGHEMAVIGMVMGQIRSVGKLLTQDLRQLQSRGINLADMLKNQLGVSVDQFNAGLESGKYTMDDLLNLFTEFASKNFADAGKRMARTFQGIKATLNDLKETAYITLLKQPFDKVTAILADGLGVIQEFVMQSGVLEKIGAKLNTFVDNLLALGKGILNWLKPAFDLFAPGGAISLALRDVVGWAKMIWENLKGVGAAIWTLVKPAFDWLAARVKAVDWSPMLTHLRDTVNMIGQVIYNLVTAIQRILSGNAEGAVAPLKQAFSYVLTWLVLTWDKFAANAVSWGWNLIVQIANGIYEGAKKVLQSVMQVVGTIIGWFVKPGSPPKKGPLSHIVEWGRGLINTYIQAFKTADFGLLRDALSPIKQALQDAVGAGTISESEFPTLFAGIRTDVARLISIFRETGEISEEVLGGIAAKLGEGGEELTKYLRLQLKFQQAQNDLAAISKEVEQAQRQGFVPKALQDKLKAAQEAADAAKDELDWQKEYLSLQQESVDLQLQLVKALEKVGKSLGDAADKLAKAAGGKEGMQTPTVTPFTTSLGDVGGLGDDLDDMETSLTELDATVRGVSEDFQNAKKKVDEFLNTPFSEHVATLVDKLEKATGLDFSKITDFFANLKGISWQSVGTALGKLGAGLWQNLKTGAAGAAGGLGQWLNGQISNLRTRLPFYAQNLGYALGQLFGKALEFLTVTMPTFGQTLSVLVVGAVASVADWLVKEAIPTAQRWYYGFLALMIEWYQTIKRALPQWIVSFIRAFKGFVMGFIQGFIEQAPDWMIDALEWGKQFVAKLKEGLANAWDMIPHIRAMIMDWVAKVKERIGLWLYRVREFGETFVQKIKDGLNSAWNLYEEIKAKVEALGKTLNDNGSAVLASIVAFGGLIVEKIKEGITSAWDLAKKFGELLSKLPDELFAGTEGGSVLNKLLAAGANIIEAVWLGILNIWPSIVQRWRELLKQLKDNLPFSEPKDPRSPLRNLAKSGKALAQNFIAGLDFAPANEELRRQLAQTRAILNSAGIGLNVQQSYTFGSLVFPNVRDGRDAVGLERTLSRLTLQGRLLAQTQGS